VPRIAGLLRMNLTPANRSAGDASSFGAACCIAWIPPVRIAPNSQNATIDRVRQARREDKREAAERGP